MKKMEIRTLSEKRGILSFYNGDRYIIYSTFYGVVAESTEIIRDEETDDVIINFDICDWCGYWDLKSIISRGINKAEKQFIDKNVKINYNILRDQQMHLNRNIKIETIKY